ncbi:MAG TPA: hypothetical protein VNL77_07615 [Roseiflexaceae bacterium]|nr:hypothetical protein [Roseiflexaceae bacterium]
MPRWVTVLLLSMGLSFLAAGAVVGVAGARQAQAHLAAVERLPPLPAAPLALTKLQAIAGTVSAV